MITMKEINLLFAESSFTHDDLLDYPELKNNLLNLKILKNPYGRRLNASETVELGRGCSGIVAGLEPYTKDVLKELKDLRCISRVGVGIDNIDLDAANQHGIMVLNTPDAPTRAVSEMAIGLIFSLLRGIPLVDHQMKSGIWKKFTGHLLYDKTIGIIGAGRIGKTTATLLQSLGAHVLVNDINPDGRWLSENNITNQSLNEVLSNAEVVVLHMAFSSNEKPILNKDTIALMKEGSYLINLSRGNAVDESALYEALSSEKLSGAALDVFQNEPYSGVLASLDNVILTPHIGSQTFETRKIMKRQAVANLINFLISSEK